MHVVHHQAFQQLNLGNRPLHFQQGFLREYRRSFRNRMYRTTEAEFPQPVQKPGLEPAQGFQALYVFVGKGERFNNMGHVLLATGKNEITVLRKCAKEKTENPVLVHAFGPVRLGHSQLIQIHQQRQVSLFYNRGVFQHSSAPSSSSCLKTAGALSA